MRDIAWAAGLVEGEGCILASDYRRPGGRKSEKQIRLAVEMTDRDVLERLRSILGRRARLRERRPPSVNPRHRRRWILTLNGPDLIGWLQTLYPFLGERRRAAARKAISLWVSAQRRRYRGGRA